MVRKRAGMLAATALLLAAFTVGPAAGEGHAILLPPPTLDAPKQAGREVAVLAGGCFWGVQGVFQHVAGVTRAVSGYSGGKVENPTYEQVAFTQTGHAEAVEVTFDPAVVSYGEILRIYFSVAHDPTELDRQGPDEGPQYRSHVFTTSAEQEKIARAYIAQLDGAKLFGQKIATRIDPLTKFYPAEDYHQDYLTLNPHVPYIVFFDMPKLADLKRLFPQAWRDKPVLVKDAKS